MLFLARSSGIVDSISIARVNSEQDVSEGTLAILTLESETLVVISLSNRDSSWSLQVVYGLLLSECERLSSLLTIKSLLAAKPTSSCAGMSLKFTSESSKLPSIAVFRSSLSSVFFSVTFNDPSPSLKSFASLSCDRSSLARTSEV